MLTDLKFEGGAEIQAMLLELSKTFSPRQARGIFNRALKKALNNLKDEMKSRTPVDTGFSKKSIKVVVRAPKKAELAQWPDAIVVASIGFTPKDPTLGQIINIFVMEYGDDGRLPLRIIRGSTNLHAERIFDDILNLFQIEINKAIEKQRRKAGL